jgi:glycosyltransferase involved in cell wall biosynthesis
MRVLNLQIALSGGGAEKVTELLAPEMELATIEFARVACIGPTSSQKNTSVLCDSDTFFSRIVLAPLGLLKSIISYQPDIIHIHCERPEFTLAVASLLPKFPKKENRPKVFVTEHTSRPWTHAPLLGKLVRKRLVSLNAYWYTCIEEDPTKTFIPNPVQPLSTLQKSSHLPRIFFIGRLVPGKRVNQLIEVAEKIKNCPDVLIIGDGPERSYLENLAEGNSKIQFMGALDRPWDAIREGDLYVSASEYEGSPLTLLEGLSLGVEVLVSDIPAHRKLLPPESLFADVGELKRKIDAKLSRDAKMAPYGDRLSIDKFIRLRRPRNVAQQWVNEYKRVIRGFD